MCNDDGPKGLSIPDLSTVPIWAGHTGPRTFALSVKCPDLIAIYMGHPNVPNFANVPFDVSERSVQLVYVVLIIPTSPQGSSQM